MTKLRTERLIIRNWQEHDRDLFHEINSDPAVMEFFTFRRNRTEADAKMDELRRAIEERGYGWFALAQGSTNEAVGFAGLADTDEVPAYRPTTVEIGWRLPTRHWGKGYATEAGQALLRWGFETLKLPEIVSYAVATNHRSTAVMERLGLIRRPEFDFDHSAVGDKFPHLKRHVFYALTREEWQAGKASP